MDERILRFLLRLMLSLALLFSLLVGAACVLGGLLPYPAREFLRQFECESQPCWHGIRMGVTTLEEARDSLSGDETLRIATFDTTTNYLCWAWTNGWHNVNSEWDACYFATPNNGIMLQITYAGLPPLRLGDVLPLLSGTIRTNLMCYERIASGLVFDEHLGVQAYDPLKVHRVVPELPIASLTYFAPGANATVQLLRYDWKGFTGSASVEGRCSI